MLPQLELEREERKLENNITMKDCEALYRRFVIYTETAEQHEFAILAMVQCMLDRTMDTWNDPIDQKEARAMFRVVLSRIGGDIAPYLEGE